jgi:hypothetical protein
MTTGRRDCLSLRESLVTERLYAGEPKSVYVSCSTCRTNDGFGNKSSCMPGTLGGRCRVICRKEHVPRDLQRRVELFITKSLPCSLEFGLPHCDVPRLDNRKQLDAKVGRGMVALLWLIKPKQKLAARIGGSPRAGLAYRKTITNRPSAVPHPAVIPRQKDATGENGSRLTIRSFAFGD